MVRIRHLASVTLTCSVAAMAMAPAVGVHAQSPITLRLASPDLQGRASTEPINFFVDEVARRSGGSITIQPEFGVTGDDPKLLFEQGAAAQLSAGNYDLGVIASRGWDESHITTPWALQAPFLIDNDALAIAVSQSPVAQEVLDGMSGAGVTGLSLWPEDLRHPFAFVPFGKPFLSPDDFKGTTIRAIPSHVGWELLRDMGATPMIKDNYGYDVDRGLIQGAESGLRQGGTLPADPTATGNVTFFPKYEVLVANSAALAQLSDDQRAILKDASLATRDHVASNHPSDVQAGADWCTGSQGRIVLASDAQVAAFKTSAAPIYTELEADPVVKKIIDDITALKAATPASPSAAACQPAPRPTPPATVDQTAATLPPSGTYQASITAQDLIDRGWSQTRAPDMEASWFLTFDNGAVTLHPEGAAPSDDCPGTYALHENVVRIDFTPCEGEAAVDFQWASDAAGALNISVVSTTPTWYYADDSAFFGRTWAKVE